MLADIDWNRLRAEVTYVESDSTAEICTAQNTIGSYPVFLNAATNDPYVRLGESFVAVDDLKQYNPRDPRSTGFIQYRLVPRKQLYDPLQGRTVET
jgi:hypothetical protein